MIRRRRPLFVAASTASLLLANSGDAAASGYLTARFGADHGTPAMATPYAVYFNPAAMGGMGSGSQLVLDGSLALRQVTYSRTPAALSPSGPEASENPLYRATNTGDARLFNALALPYAGFVTGLGTRDLRLGAALYVPFGGIAFWDKTSRFEGNQAAPGGVDGPQRWHNINGQILAGYTTLAVSYTLPGTRISLGLSGSLVTHHVSTVRARNADGSDDINTPAGALKEGRSLLDVWGFNAAMSAGVYWEVDEARRLRIGVSYLSQPGFGTTRMPGYLKQQFGTDPSVAQKNDADLLLDYPDIIRFGIAARVSRAVELRADAEYVRWSTFKRQCVTKPGAECTVDDTGRDTSPTGNVVLNIPRNFKDAIGLRFGPAYFVDDRTEIFASLGVTTAAMSPQYIDPSAIDATRLYVTLGGRYTLSDHWALAMSANYIGFAQVDTKGRSEFYRFASPSTSPSADGVYTSALFLLNANLTYSF